MDAVLHRVSSPTFVGRADELDALGAALDRAAAGVPAFTFVAGESGVGKSRLLTEFEARATAAGARVFLGHCLELNGTAIPYAPLVDALRPLARDLAARCTDIADTMPPGTRAALAELLPEFGGGPSAPADDSSAIQARVFEALLSLLERLGREQPVVLLLEDLHWADPSTRDFLTFLVRSARTEPLCLVVTYRSDELHRRHPLRPLLAELERTPGVERLGVERFSRDEVAAQVSAILETPASDELADQLFERSEGNALYTEELLAARSSGCLELPDSLRDLLLHRVERLPAGAQNAVRVASVEHPMRHELLAALTDTPSAELLQGLRDAVAHQVLVAGPDDTYAFRHALVGEAVYTDLLPGERSELHMRLAETLEAQPELMGDVPPASVSATLACHWAAAHDMPRALGASVAAGLASKRVYAFREAMRHFERALELWDRVPDAEERAGCDRPDLLRHTAAAASHAGASARAVALVRKAIEEVDPEADPVRASFLHERLGHYLRGAGDTEEGFAAYERATALLPEGEGVQRARLMEHRARGLVLRGRLGEAREEAAGALAMAARLDTGVIQARALNTLGLSTAALGAVEEGLALLRQARDLAAVAGPPVEHVQAVMSLSEVLDLSGRTAEALAEVDACLHDVRMHPERTTYHACLELQGVNHAVRLGRLAEQSERLRTGQPGDALGITPIYLHELRARVALMTGDLAVARANLEELRRLCLGTLDPQWLEPLYGASAQVALLQERIDDARASVERGLSLIGPSDDGGRLARLIWIGLMVEATAAERARALGEPFDEAVAESLLDALSAAETKPAQWAEGRLHAALARAEHSRLKAVLGEGLPDPATWVAIADDFAALSYPWPAAYAGFRAGEAFVQAGDRAGAAAPLASARAAADTMGAAPLLGEIDALARRARVALDARAGEEPDVAEDDPAVRLGLTPRELEVLLLVAAGRTNREIGAELYMSEKTASVHVSRILAKFGVSGRVEAAAVAHRLGLTAAAAA